MCELVVKILETLKTPQIPDVLSLFSHTSAEIKDINEIILVSMLIFVEKLS